MWGSKGNIDLSMPVFCNLILVLKIFSMIILAETQIKILYMKPKTISQRSTAIDV
jgi:hypothetical protein